jgi:hypothetical protein
MGCDCSSVTAGTTQVVCMLWYLFGESHSWHATVPTSSRAGSSSCGGQGTHGS